MRCSLLVGMVLLSSSLFVPSVYACTTTHDVIPLIPSSTLSIITPETVATSTESLPLSLPAQDERPAQEIPLPTLCLAMIAPAPSDGREWVAFHGLTPSSSSRLIGFSLHDAGSSLVKFSSSTPLLWDEASATLRYELTSARLNNTGDTVRLLQPDGTAHDTFTYTKTPRDARWMRENCESAWRMIDVAPIPVEATAPPPVIDPPTMHVLSEPLPDVPDTTPPAEPLPIPNILPLAEEPLPPPAHILQEESPSFSHSTTTIIQAIARVKKPPKKSSTKKTPTKTLARTVVRKTLASAPSITSFSMSTLLDEASTHTGTRVRLTGTVASTPRLVGAQRFVLINADGRGLLIHGTAKHPSPARGTHIELTGTLFWNDDGMWLKQYAQDSWKTLEAPLVKELPLKEVPLLAPALEDMWAHIETEMTIVSLSASSLEGVTSAHETVRIKLPRALGYRAGRLEKGDTLRVRGLLTTQNDTPTILPQRIEDVEILARAPLPSTAKPPQKPFEHPWLPVGLVGGTLAASEGWRRSQRWRQGALERIKLAQKREKEPHL